MFNTDGAFNEILSHMTGACQRVVIIMKPELIDHITISDIDYRFRILYITD